MKEKHTDYETFAYKFQLKVHKLRRQLNESLMSSHIPFVNWAIISPFGVVRWKKRRHLMSKGFCVCKGEFFPSFVSQTQRDRALETPKVIELIMLFYVTRNISIAQIRFAFGCYSRHPNKFHGKSKEMFMACICGFFSNVQELCTNVDTPKLLARHSMYLCASKHSW